MSNRLGNYPGLLITISLSIALFLIGFCGWIAISSNELIKYIKQNIELQIFLDSDIGTEDSEKLKNYLSNLEITEIKDQKPQLSLITKEKAAEIFYKETKENYKEILGENPFRASFVLKLKPEYIQEDQLKSIKTHIEKQVGVYEVNYAQDFLKGIIDNINKIYKFLTFVVLAFFIATVFLINNTIKLALYSQRFIIRTMQLVGATDKFIQKPFLKNGIVQGIVAALISIVTISLFRFLVISQIDSLEIIQNNRSLIILFLLLIILGPVIGFLSTYQSIIRYHKMELDKLY